ncbi:hypothetical protein D3C86_2044800 [compost metagenome]
MGNPGSDPFPKSLIIQKHSPLGRPVQCRTSHVLHQLGHFFRLARTGKGDGNALQLLCHILFSPSAHKLIVYQYTCIGPKKKR